MSPITLGKNELFVAAVLSLVHVTMAIMVLRLE